MKFRVLAASMLVLACFAVPMVSHAATASQSIGVGAGVVVPTGDAADAVGMGFYGGGTYTYKFNAQFGVGGDVAYNTFGKKNDVDLKFHMLQYGVHGKYYFPMKDAKMAPYLKVGVGMYSISETLPGVDIGGGVIIGGGTYSASKTGFAAGVGTTFAMGPKASFGIEAMYHMIQTEGSSTSMFTAGATYNFMLGK